MEIFSELNSDQFEKSLPTPCSLMSPRNFNPFRLIHFKKLY